MHGVFSGLSSKQTHTPVPGVPPFLVPRPKRRRVSKTHSVLVHGNFAAHSWSVEHVISGAQTSPSGSCLDLASCSYFWPSGSCSGSRVGR